MGAYEFTQVDNFRDLPLQFHPYIIFLSVLAPLTAGASLGLKVAGTAVAVSGAITSTVNSFRDNNPKLVEMARNEEAMLKKEVQDLESLFALYLTAVYHEENHEFSGLRKLT